MTASSPSELDEASCRPNDDQADRGSVVPVDGDKFGTVGVSTDRAGHGRLLRLEVAQEPIRDQTRDEPVGVADGLGSDSVPEDDFLVRHEEDQKDGGIADLDPQDL